MQNQEQRISEVCIEAIRNLDFDHSSSDKYLIYKLKSFIKGILATFHLRETPYYLTWRTGMLAKALFHMNDLCPFCKMRIRNDLERYLDTYISKDGKILKLDNVQNGEIAIYLYKVTGKEGYLSMIESYISYVEKYVKDQEGALPFLDDDNIYVDGLMICPFLFMYTCKLKENHTIYEMGMNQIMTYINFGFDDKLDLPYHAYCLKSGMQLGIVGWGRGTGWFLYSVVDSLQYINENDKRKEVIALKFKKVVDTTLQCQHEDGLFSWFHMGLKGPIDSSATAMILYSIAKGVNIGVLNGKYKDSVIKGYESLRPFVREGKVYQAMGDCKGLGMYPQTYDSYPWSIAFYLLLCAEIIKW